MRTEIVLWTFASVMSLAALAYSAGAVRKAKGEYDEAISALQTTRRQVATLQTLQAALPIDPRASSAEPGLATRVTSTLERAGLSAGVLANFSPGNTVVVGSAGEIRVTRGRATIALAGLTLPQAGRFLDAWRMAEPKWVPTSIDLSPAVTRAPEVGGDLPLRVVIVIESLQVIRNGDGH